MRDIMLIVHFLGLVMGLGTSFAHAFLGAATAKMNEEEATKFRLNAMVLSKMGHIGIFLLLVSGIYLILPYWPSIGENPLLIVKLVLVAFLIVLITLISRGTQKAHQGNAEEQLKKIEPLGKLTLLVGLAILIVAVNVFH
jgi:uncharacterized membrane protein